MKNPEIYEKINYYALSTPKPPKSSNQYALPLEESGNLPTPNILKYSREDITPSKASYDRSKRYSSESRMIKNSDHPINSLTRHLSNQANSESPYRKISGNSIIKNSQYNYTLKSKDKRNFDGIVKDFSSNQFSFSKDL